jgi:hypothetical protein
VQVLVTIAGDDREALVPLASSGVLAKVTGGVESTLNQSWVRVVLGLLEQQQYSPVLESAEREGHFGMQEDESERFPERKPRLAGVNQVDRAY